MTEAAPTSINCTSCGAALPALGGHKTRTLNCSYCGAVMDKHAGYQILAQYRDMQRPPGPLNIGDTGVIKGVEQTVIGIVGNMSEDFWGKYYWTDYQLYSPTHGYSWITVNNGHTVFSRKIRRAPDADIAAPLARREMFGAMGRQFQTFETYRSKITYVEGELTWVAMRGDECLTMEGIDPPQYYAITWIGSGPTGEIEYETGEYLEPEELREAFGVDPPVRQGVHAAQPFRPGRFAEAISNVALWFLPVAAACVFLVLAFGQGATIATARLTDMTQGESMEFTIPDPPRLTSVKARAPLSNSWAYYEFILTHIESDEELAEFGRDIEYYHGRDSDGAWTEGSRSVTISFLPPAPGAYRLSATSPESEKGAPYIDVTVKTGIWPMRWFVILTVLFGALAGWMILRRNSFEKRRWGDDDDDE